MNTCASCFFAIKFFPPRRFVVCFHMISAVFFWRFCVHQYHMIPTGSSMRKLHKQKSETDCVSSGGGKAKWDDLNFFPRGKSNLPPFFPHGQLITFHIGYLRLLVNFISDF
ncbi:hypothetical protein VN97_g10073 [Penicillium thymicola]|uniref:Uncharacterized protein n=1 Tax=Penicillium thymicola TaxID=293382 RepID=A0AAI9TB60_PENTH|nr:hypothetical protein VN97_g10073 [Penicillium thymicola]